MSTPLTDTEEVEHRRMQACAFSQVSHDLKTPLACIIGALETIAYLHHTISDEQRTSLIQMALLEAQKLNGIFTRMLDKATPK